MKTPKMVITLTLKDSARYCEGTVQPSTVKREAFKHKDGFVILEDVTIGVCDRCGNRYYSADILHTVDAVATGELNRFQSLTYHDQPNLFSKVSTVNAA